MNTNGVQQQIDDLHPVSVSHQTGVSFLPPVEQMHTKRIERMLLLAYSMKEILPEFNGHTPVEAEEFCV